MPQLYSYLRSLRVPKNTSYKRVFFLSPKGERYTIKWDNVSDDEEYAAALNSNDPGRVTVYNPLGWAANDEDLHLELSEMEDEVPQTEWLIICAAKKRFFLTAQSFSRRCPGQTATRSRT